MPSSPLLPLMPSGDLPPAMAVVRWLEDLRRDGVDAVVAGGLPWMNGSLPDLLALGGIRHLLLDGAPVTAFRWQGRGGAAVAVTPAEGAPADGLPLHHGRLPARPLRVEGDDATLHAQAEVARLEDAAAALAGGGGARWEDLLAALDRGHAPRAPVLRPRPADGAGGAWNPLPFPREAVVALPADARPWGLVDGRGRRHPAQVVEGPTGSELLASLPLGALECTTLAPLDEPVAGSHWEVDEGVLDNGVLRAELDARGQVVRLCAHGVFAELAGPAVVPLLDGVALDGSAAIEVVEAGPVRARVVATRSTAHGTLRISYSLHAHEDVLRVSAAWNGEERLLLDHPSAHRGALLRLAGELAPERLEQSDDVFAPAMTPRPGVRWAALDDGGGRGLAVVGGRPLPVAACGGSLQVACDGSLTAYALGLGARTADALSFGHLAQHLAMPARGYSGGERLAAPFRLAGSPGLVPLWVRAGGDGGSELLVADHLLRRGRAWLHTRGAVDGWLVDAAGNQLERLERSPEGDALQLDHGPGAVLIVRFKAV